jgi:hypothetical protein
MFQGSRGVTVPANQGSPANEGTPNSVVNVMEAKFVMVEYYDGNGRFTRDTLIEAGGNYYSPPNSVAWTSEVKRVRPWLEEGVRRKQPLDNVQVSDNVEVIVGG